MNNDCKGIFDAYTNTDQTITTGSPLVFNINRARAGRAITHPAGSSVFSLNCPGLYKVNFNGDAAESGTAGDIMIQLFVNGVLQPGAEATEDSTATTDIVNMAFGTTVCVTPACFSCGNSVSLTFVDTGVGAVFSNAEVVIEKIR